MHIKNTMCDIGLAKCPDGCGAHPSSYSWVVGFFPRVKLTESRYWWLSFT